MNARRLGKIVLWLLFWYYLAPYYLLKKYLFRNNKHQILWSSLSSIIIVFALFGWWMNSIPDNDSDTAATAKTHYVVKKVGQGELTRAKAKEKVLNKEEKKKQAEYEKLSASLKEEKTKAKKEAEKRAKEIEEEHREANTQAAVHSHNHAATNHTVENHGDMNTAETGRIVGNRNSHIYHVPGQAGYRMNSSNAVYFNSEAEAKAAGYRKALR